MTRLSRRGFLIRGGALGCSLAASPLLTPVTLAAAPWETRLVVIILRGAMDGLDVVQPYGDPDMASLRRTLGTGEAAGAHDLDGFYALHPGLADLMPLWRAGQLGFAHAVSTPYRDKRSHFDGQDLLEAGTGPDMAPGAVRDGWLNRMLQAVPGVRAETAFAIGLGEMPVLSGSAPFSVWSPESRLGLSPATEALMGRVVAGDPLFGDAFGSAIEIAASLDSDGVGGAASAGQGGRAHQKVAEFAASRLRAETRVAAFSLNGWDTHARQAGGLGRALRVLSETILSLQSGLGPVWDRTAVLAMTEFGRTAHENGSLGTDHGTGGAMLMTGGAVRGGQVLGDWPGLAHGDLYAGRDLMPTADVRAYAAAAMQGLFGLNRDVLEGAVFPGLDMGHLERIIL